MDSKGYPSQSCTVLCSLITSNVSTEFLCVDCVGKKFTSVRFGVRRLRSSFVLLPLRTVRLNMSISIIMIASDLAVSSSMTFLTTLFTLQLFFS